MKYRALIERAAFGIYRSTEDGRILEANPSLVRMLGCDSVDDVLALNMSDVYESAADRTALIEGHRGQPGGTVEIRWKKKNGDPILVRLTARTIVGRDGRESYETIAEDVTEKRALEEQLRQAQKMEAVGRLARGLVHPAADGLQPARGAGAAGRGPARRGAWIREHAAAHHRQ
jgi:PAS domain S-box-containing protein